MSAVESTSTDTGTVDPSYRLRVAWIVPHTLDNTLFATARVGPARALQQMGCCVTMIAVGPPGQDKMNELDVVYRSMPSVFFFGQMVFHFRAALYLMRKWSSLDVIFFQQVSGLWLLPLRMFGLFSGSRRPLIVMDTRDLMDVTPGGRKRVFIWMYLYRLVARMARVLADGQTAITSRMAQLVGIPRKQLLGTWPSGVDPAIFSDSRRTRQWPKSSDPIHLIYIGTLVVKRNPMAAARAVVQANREGMSFVLTFLGQGREASALAEFAMRSGGAVRLEPPVPAERIPEMLAKAHVGVTSLPTAGDTKYQASSPIKLFEYMAAGMPILATRNACHTDVVGEGRYVFWADEPNEDDLVDALRNIWSSRALLPTLGEEAADAALNWTWAEAGRKLYDALLNGIQRRSVLDIRRLQTNSDGRS